MAGPNGKKPGNGGKGTVEERYFDELFYRSLMENVTGPDNWLHAYPRCHKSARGTKQRPTPYLVAR